MLSLKHLANYSNQLSLALRSGIPITQVLSILERNSSTKRLRYISARMREAIESGLSLEQAFRNYDRDFPAMFISLIAAGEKTGHTAEVASQLSDFYESRYKIASAMKWDLATTGVYLCICLAIMIFIDYVMEGWEIGIVIKRLEQIAIFVIFFILLPQVLYKNSKLFRTAISNVLQWIPFLGSALKKLIISRFSSTMALGIKAGLNIRETIYYAAQSTANPIFERKIMKAIEKIDKGESVAESLAETGVFPYSIIGMYMTGEKSGTLYDMMYRTAVITQEQGENALKTISQITVRLLYLAVLIFVAYRIVGYWQKIYGNLQLSL